MRTLSGSRFLALLTLLLAPGCRPLSESARDPAVGFNGGFEHVEAGRPVNWSVYSPRTVPEGDFEIVPDETEVQEGQRSLAFHVRSCSSGGGWASPGVFQEFEAEAGHEYEVDFWIRSHGCTWQVTYGAVAASNARFETISSQEVQGEDWQHVVRRFRMPDAYQRQRFELSVRTPGDLWIDAVRVRPVPDRRAEDV
jgi:hypothetical protein